MFKNSKLFKGLYNWSVLSIIIVAVVLINIIGAFVYMRLDMTKDPMALLRMFAQQGGDQAANFDAASQAQGVINKPLSYQEQ